MLKAWLTAAVFVVAVLAFGWALWPHPTDGFLTLLGLAVRLVYAAGFSLVAIAVAFAIYGVARWFGA